MCFVPDSQVIFTHVFLADIEGLPHHTCMYKDCFDLLRKQYNYLILPSGVADFSNLIIEKLQKFLAAIDSEIANAKVKQVTKNEFIAKTRSRLNAINTFGRHFGDLMLLWETKKEYFWSLVAKDRSLTRREMIDLTTVKTKVFYRICSEHEVEFSGYEKALSEKLFLLIKDSRKKGAIKHSANDPDLLILADCFIYKGERLDQGVMYLITDDREFYGTTIEIIEHPNLVFPEFKVTEKYIGFEPLKPEIFISNFKTKLKTG